MIDQWTERLHCVQCGGTGLASLSHFKGTQVPTVESVTGSFRAVCRVQGARGNVRPPELAASFILKNAR
jgi:hypothetical protein